MRLNIFTTSTGLFTTWGWEFDLCTFFLWIKVGFTASMSLGNASCFKFVCLHRYTHVACIWRIYSYNFIATWISQHTYGATCSNTRELHPVSRPSFLFFLSYYYCRTGGTMWHLQKFLHYIIVEFTPPSFSFFSIPFLEWFQQVSLFHFHTYVHSICTMFTLLHPFPPPAPYTLVTGLYFT
jgi:hypothetical protein